MTWDGFDPGDLPPTDEAESFAAEVADAMSGHTPPGWVLDVGRLDDGRWAVVETNPAWSSNPYWATEGGATGVVATILSAQEPSDDERWRWQVPPTIARPLPVRHAESYK